MRVGGRPSAIAVLGALSACASGVPQMPARTDRPMRVMSLNLCTDQLVLALLPPERIASVTWLARNPSGSLMAHEAMRVGINHGVAEDVLEQRPDLVVAGSFTAPALRAMLKRLHYPMIEVEQAGTIDDIRTITRQVARAVGEPARGAAMIARMDRQFAELARNPGPAIPVVAWDRSGFSAGDGTLYDTVLSAAGARNLARNPASLGYRKPDVEVLLQVAPALLVQGTQTSGAASLGDDVVQHRLVRRFWSGPRTLTISQAYYACGTPMVADGAVALRRKLRRAAALARTAPIEERAPR